MTNLIYSLIGKTKKQNSIFQSIWKFLTVAAIVIIGGLQSFAQVVNTYNTTTSGITFPAGVTSIQVQTWGGGGGGGGASANNAAAGGGGGGAYAIGTVTVVPVTGSYTATVGGAGAGGTTSGTSGSAGGASSFTGSAGTVSAGGGTGGTGATTAVGAAGGAGSSTHTGTVTYNGGTGGNGTVSTSGGGGGGSAGTASNGNNGSGVTGGAAVTGGGAGGNGSTGTATGTAGSAPGGGGGGGKRTSTSRAGGAGAAGRVVITYTLPACSGTPAPGNTVASANPVCGGTNFTLSLSNSFATVTGITYQWQSSTLGTFTGTGGDVLTNLGTAATQVTSQTNSLYYQCIVTCTNSSLSANSTALLVTMLCTSPVGGTTVSSANPVCGGNSFTLSLSGASTCVTYQWQSSTLGTFTGTGGDVLTNLGTASTQTTSQTSPLYYRCVVSCSGNSANSTPLQVTMNGFTLPEGFTSGVIPPGCWTIAGTSASTYMLYSSLSSYGVGTGSMYFNDYNAPVGGVYQFISPTYSPFGSGTQTLTFDESYEGYSTAAGFPDSLDVFASTNGGTTYTEIISYTATQLAGANGFCSCVFAPTSTTWQTWTVTLPAGTNRIYFQNYSADGNNMYIDNINITANAACSGTPTPGATVASANPVCPNANFTLSLGTSYIGVTGLTFQWQSSTLGTFTGTGGDVLTNLGTASTQTTSQTSALYYQCIVTCSNGGLSGTSTPLQVTMNAFSNCYCVPPASDLAGDDWIGFVGVGTLSNTTPTSPAGSYLLVPPSTTTTNLTQGVSNSITLTVDGYSGYFDVFVDLNHDGIYESTEQLVADFAVGPVTTSGSYTGTTTFTIPYTALTGATGMRVRQDYLYTGYPNCTAGSCSSGAETGCQQLYEGTTEDFTVTILPAPPCSGTPAPGNTITTANPVCSTTSFTLSLQNQTIGTGVTYQWQSSTLGTFTGTGGDVLTNLGTSYNQVIASQTSALYYQCIVTCASSSGISTPIQILESPCYCTPPQSVDYNCCSMYISNVTTTNGITNFNESPVNPEAASYGNYTGTKICSQLQGSTITLSVTDAGYGMDFNVYVDWNQDGLFTDAGDLVLSSSTSFGNTSPGTLSASFTVPATAVPGITRMRVRADYYGSGYPTGPCNQLTYGQTEDYGFNVIAPTPCSGTPTAGTATAMVTQSCTGSATAVLSLTNTGTPTTGISYQWDSAAVSGGPYFPVTGGSGATTIVYTTPTLTANAYYVCVTTCSNSSMTAQSNEQAVVPAAPPAVTSVTSATRCGTGTASLQATASAGSTVNWYANSTGGSPLGSGSPFTTPVVNSTTVFYAEADAGGGVSNVGAPAATASAVELVATSNYGLVFTVTSAITLQTVVVNPYAATAGSAGTITIGLFNCTASGSLVIGSQVNTATVSCLGYPTVNANPQTVTLGFTITPGTYFITPTAWSGAITGIYFDDPQTGTMGFPYTAPGVSINYGSYGGGLYQFVYYCFYNWTIGSGCSSARSMDTVYVTAPPSVSVASAASAVCSGHGTSLTASSSDPNYSYLWTPGNIAGATVSVSPTSGTTYTVTAVDNTAGPNFGCAIVDTASIAVNPLPVLNLSPTSATICSGTSINLTASLPSSGDVVSYGFAQSSGSWNAITGGTQIISGTWDDGAYNGFSIGFNFRFAGTTYTTFSVDINGYVRLGNTVVSSEFCDSNWVNFGANVLAVAGLGGDLHSNGNAASEVRYQTIGTSPNQQLVVQWLHCMHYASPNADDWNFQVVLNQSSNSVQVIWGPNTDVTVNGPNYGCADANGDGFATGLIGTGLSDANLAVVTAGTNTFANPTIAYTVTGGNYVEMTPTNVPATGLTWTWYPPTTGGNFSWLPFSSLSADTGSVVTATPPATQTYTVVTTDNNGCTNSATSTISLVLSPTAALLGTTNASCNGGSNGSATVSVTSGTGPYTYLWSNGTSTTSASTSNTVNGLSKGTYSVSVSVANNTCFAIVSSIGISQPNALAANQVVNNISCHGGSNGSVTLAPAGGTPGYTYLWSNSATTSALTNQGVNLFNVTITDSHGCTATSSAQLTQPGAIVVSPSVANNVSCNGGSNGSVSISASGGTPPYNGTGTITGLSAGTYTYVVTDGNGCTSTSTPVTITQPSALSASASASANVSCNGGSNGTALVAASGGTAPYSGTGSFTGLSAGGYTYIVTDSKGCTAFAIVTINQPSAISVSPSSTVSVCFGANINLTSSASGGTGTLTYAWTGPNAYSATGANPPAIPNAASINSGPYSLTVTDANNCSVTSTTTVTVISCVTVLNLKMYTQGYYLGGGEMNTVLLNEFVCPSCFTQVDTFTVEVRNTSSPWGVVESVKIILNTDGTGTAVFSANVAGHSYYIAIHHRNTIQTWSKLPYAFTTSGNSYDFSSAVTQAYSASSLPPMVQVDGPPLPNATTANPVWAFYTGDINQDDNIDLIDFPPLDFGINNGYFGYYAQDLNGDGNVDLLDFPLLDANINAGIFAQYP